jgi:hypothetical protein
MASSVACGTERLTSVTSTSGIRGLVAELADQGAPALAASEPLLEAAE